MITASGNRDLTVLIALVEAIRSATAFDKNDVVPPSALLWPDEDRAWADVMPKLRAVMPQLLTLGKYDPATMTGPAIWIKTMLGRDESGARLLPQADWADDAVPVIYLPGVSRQQLRPTEECPADIKVLCELQFRGVVWTQINSKDWTPRAFLQSPEGGLGLNLAGDAATLGAMRQSLVKLMDEQVSQLKGRVLDASDFHSLLAPDASRTLLEWMSDPDAFKARMGTGWSAFRTVCRDKFGFDPDKTDITEAGQRLAERQGDWGAVWGRYGENPALYPGVKDVLRRSKPDAGALFVDLQSVYPQDNGAAEQQLRDELESAGKMSDAAARKAILELESKHAPRRSLVWAKLGEAPLADALRYLAELAQLSSTSLGGADRNQAAELYATSGWRVDDAAMRSLAAVKSTNDLHAVGAAVTAIYKPWLEKAAEHFQKLVKANPLPSATDATTVDAEPGTCLVFADALRMDLAQRLAAELTQRGLTVNVGWRWSAVPTVTATAKPAASPAVRQLDKASKADDFVPRIVDGGKELTSDRFRSILSEMGVQPLTAYENGDVSGAARAWLEVGTIDKRGHHEGVRLASLLVDEIRSIADRIGDLIAAGWSRVKVVTDHGWLLVPGGLPKVTLPKYLAETRWGRCASVKENASPDCQQHGWHWNPGISIAIAPGISCFREGTEYAHGGLSVQEAVTPEIIVNSSSSGMGGGVSIESVVWKQLMGRVKVSGSGGAAVDLRHRAADAKSTLMESDEPRPIDADGNAKIFAKDDAEGKDAEVVVLDAGGKVICRRQTKVGME